MPPVSGSALPGSASTPATRRRRSTPGRGGRAGARCCRSRASRGSTARRRCRDRRTSMPPKAGSRSAAARGCGRSPSPPSRARPTGSCGSTRPTDEERRARGPAGFIHLPRGVDAEWVKQLVAEQLVTVKTKRGFTRLEWQKLRERNEALDCRVYARAAAWIAGVDRWSEERWAEAEREVSVERGRRRRPRGPDGGGGHPEPSGSPDGWLGRRRGWLKWRSWPR